MLSKAPAQLLARWKNFDRNVRLHFINVGLFTLTLDGGIYTVIFNLFMLRLGFGPEQVGTVNAAGMLAFALASLPVGRLGERWSYRRMLLVGTALCVAGTLIAACAEFVSPAAQMAFMLIAVVLVFTGLASFFVNMVPYMVAFTNDHSRTSAFAVQSAIGGSFAFVGSLIGGNLPSLVATLSGSSLQTALPYRFTLLLVPLLLLISLRLGFIMRDPPPAHNEAAPENPSSPTRASNPLANTTAKAVFWLIAFFAFMRFLQVAFIGGASTFFNVYLDRELAASTANIGLIQAATRLLGIPISLIMPALSKKFGDVGVCIGASLLAAGCVLPMAFAPTWWVAGIGYIGLGIFTTLRYSTFMVFSMARTPAHLRGSCNGAQEMLAGLSFALVAQIGGALIAPLGYRFVFLSTAAVTALGTFILWVYVRRTSREAAPVLRPE
jgi:MFS family permease